MTDSSPWPVDDHRVKQIDDLPKRVREELEKFFVTASLMTKKEVRIEGWKGPKAARDAVDEAARKYVKGGTR